MFLYERRREGERGQQIDIATEEKSKDKERKGDRLPLLQPPTGRSSDDSSGIIGRNLANMWDHRQKMWIAQWKITLWVIGSEISRYSYSPAL